RRSPKAQHLTPGLPSDARGEHRSRRCTVDRIGGLRMPWSINGTEIFADMPGEFPVTTEEILDWAGEQDDIPEIVLADMRRHMPRREWPDQETFLAEVQNYTWTMPDGAREPVWGGVTQQGPGS